LIFISRATQRQGAIPVAWKITGCFMKNSFVLMSPENAWRVYVNDDNQLRWESSSGTVSFQPARSFWQRVSDFFWRLLPIESQL
jgi:hypothetical protein